MAVNDIIFRMVLKGDEFEQKLNKAKQSTRQFERDMNDLGKSVKTGVISAFTKLAGTIGAAYGAADTFNKVIKSSNELTDRWETAVRGMSNAVDVFFQSLASGDFTGFTLGLDSIISKGRQAAQALDALGNANMSYDFFSSQNQQAFADNMTLLRDKGLSAEQRDAARAAAGRNIAFQQNLASNRNAMALDAFQKLLTERLGLKSTSVSIEDFAAILYLDISPIGAEMKKNYQRQLEQYRRKLQQNTPPDQDYTYSPFMSSGLPQVDPNERAQYNMQVEALNEQYKMALLYEQSLNRESDEWLQNLINLVKEMYSADRIVTNMQRQMLRFSQDTESAAGSAVKLTGALRVDTDPGTHVAGIDLKSAAASLSRAKDSKPQENVPWIETPDVLKRQYGVVEEIGADALTATDGVTALTSALSSLGGALDSDAGKWLSWGAGVMQAIATAIPQITALTAVEANEATVSAAGAVSKGASSVAATPFVGAAMAVAAALSIAAAIASAPKFAAGGIVGGASFSGDNVLARVNSGEMVLTAAQQRILSDRLSDNMGGRVRFVIQDSQLVGILEQYNRKNSRNV